MNTKKLAVILAISLTSLFTGCDKSSGGGSTEVVTPPPKDASVSVVPYKLLTSLGVYGFGSSSGDQVTPEYGTKVHVFRDASDWYSTWSNYLANISQVGGGVPAVDGTNPIRIDEHGVPFVDFKKNMIVSISNFNTSCGSPGTEMVVEKNAEQITISYRPLPPLPPKPVSSSDIGLGFGGGFACVQVLMPHAALYSLPASDLPVVLQQ